MNRDLTEDLKRGTALMREVRAFNDALDAMRKDHFLILLTVRRDKSDPLKEELVVSIKTPTAVAVSDTDPDDGR